MNRMAISKSNEARWQSSQAAEDVLPLFKENASEMQYLKDNSDARRKYFADQAHRSLLLPKDVRFHGSIVTTLLIYKSDELRD